ncbi:MAG: hypothetical protein UDG86_07550 [Lachnospiraceae bacterium]|jgi:hypothetical protein|nr:hypothetical protein [Lachnospiraceae bacterium]
MLWYVKKGLVKSVLYHEDHLPMSYIRWHEGDYLISDADGKQQFKVSRLSPQSLHIQGSAKEGTAIIVYGESDFLMRPPRAEQLTMLWEDAVITIKQSEKRDFLLFSGETTMGSITGMFKHTVKISLNKNWPPDFAALLYVLSLFMYHEDDVNLV